MLPAEPQHLHSHEHSTWRFQTSVEAEATPVLLHEIGLRPALSCFSASKSSLALNLEAHGALVTWFQRDEPSVRREWPEEIQPAADVRRDELPQCALAVGMKLLKSFSFRPRTH